MSVENDETPEEATMNENEETYWDRVRRIEYEQNVSLAVALRVARAEERMEAAADGVSA